MRIRSLSHLVIGIMPGCSFKNFLFRRLGWKVNKSAKIGINVFWKVDNLCVGRGAKLGSLNVFRNVSSIFIEAESTLGNLNWISASPEFGNGGKASSIKLGRRSVITNRHYFDVSGGFSMGMGSALTGVRSTVLTHGVNPLTNHQEMNSVTIGRNSLIGSNAVFVPGAEVGDFQIFGMGSLISGSYANSYELYISKKAIMAKSLPATSKFFNLFDE